MWEKTVKAKENGVSNYPNWLEEREWECALLHFFSLFWEEILLILMFILAKAMSQPSPHCYFWFLFTVPSLGCRFSQAETYLLPCLLMVTCPHFIQELKDSIFPGQLSPCLSPWLVTYQPYLPGERGKCSSMISNSIMSLQMWTGLLKHLFPLMLPYKITKTKSK